MLFAFWQALYMKHVFCFFSVSCKRTYDLLPLQQQNVHRRTSCQQCDQWQWLIVQREQTTMN